MNKIIKWIISFVGILVLSVMFSSTASASRVHDCFPAPIQGRYWRATVNRGANSIPKHMYFYAVKDGFVIKNTATGTLRCKWMIYTHDYTTYVLNGAENNDLSKAVWVFITPKKNWKTVKIGYKITGINGEPKYPAAHYQHYIGTAISKVTAIVH